ncbi:hypothetical protein KC343_g10489 [Hortaea werneckii]|nr:hypothetical protein KC323_g4412 [Hortaea werneckii]KAI7203518.1 hypothetical protein KC352_g18755 [Hortaea werneckii]KAI7352001.1 hypothetical protein KC320_g4659 [Hortaea werneckii]KAI7566590.1 hypothetical protein KC317_g5568 [Hortaea werneckii]KAI7614486.1 hypothetical protein KC343_g10489 [Hortaea werneckii]
MRITSLALPALFVASCAHPIALTEEKDAAIRDFDTLWTSEALFEDGTALIRRLAKRDTYGETPAAELSWDEIAQAFIRRPAKRESDVSDTTDAASIPTDHLIRRPAKRDEEATTDETADEAIVEAFIRRPAKRAMDSASDDSVEDETTETFIRRPAKREASELESTTTSTETSSVGEEHLIRRPAKRDTEPEGQDTEESAIEDHLIRRPAKRDAEPAAQVVPGYASWGVYPRPNWQHHPPAATEAGPNLDRMVRRAA